MIVIAFHIFRYFLEEATEIFHLKECTIFIRLFTLDKQERKLLDCIFFWLLMPAEVQLLVNLKNIVRNQT